RDECSPLDSVVAVALWARSDASGGSNLVGTQSREFDCHQYRPVCVQYASIAAVGWRPRRGWALARCACFPARATRALRFTDPAAVSVRASIYRRSDRLQSQYPGVAHRSACRGVDPLRAGDHRAGGMRPDPADGPQQLVLDLDGYEGPIDLLLALAREQKVDLGRISILALADQYLAFIAYQPRLQLESAADYLVMAAWLAYLKSRLLLPQPPEDDEPSAAELAAVLERRLRLLQAMQTAGVRLMARPRLGHDVFLRGAPEGLAVVPVSVYE